ncbi:hypothetical protein RRG08_031290 [Elysia crispata]|uniref:Uncharacterized protein n=1 Tax=Elysia crispata TaxID=231223 RepID=A0AAE1AIX1_9GAST|nr:hypothetical protein RRG08_031290 [Elysia crispata]
MEKSDSVIAHVVVSTVQDSGLQKFILSYFYNSVDFPLKQGRDGLMGFVLIPKWLATDHPGGNKLVTSLDQRISPPVKLVQVEVITNRLECHDGLGEELDPAPREQTGRALALSWTDLTD